MLGRLGKHDIRENILGALREIADFGLRALQLGLEVIRRSVADGRGTAEDLLQHRRIDRCGRRPVKPLSEVAGLLRDGAVALAREHVQHGLGADDLGAGCYERWVAEVRANARVLLEHLREPGLLALLAQLPHEIRDHSARYLVPEDARIHPEQVALELPVALAYAGEVLGRFG